MRESLWMLSTLVRPLTPCPGFGQDRVNFHRNPGRGTAGRADPTPTWPNRAGYSIPCAVMLGSSGGGCAAGTHSGSRGHSGGSVRESGSVLLVCFVYSPFSVSLLLLFPLFAVLLNCRYPDLPVSACLFPSSSAPRRGEGRPRGAFVAGCSQNQNTPFPTASSWRNWLLTAWMDVHVT